MTTTNVLYLHNINDTKTKLCLQLYTVDTLILLQ